MKREKSIYINRVLIVFLLAMIVISLSACKLNSDKKEPIKVEPIEVEPIEVEPIEIEPIEIESIETESIEVDPIEVTISLFRYSNELYLFRLKIDGTLEVLLADRYINLIEPQNIEMDIVKSSSIMLSQDQLAKLNQIVRQIQDFEPNRSIIVRGAWDVVASIGGEICNFTYGVAKDKNLDELVTMLIEISPVKIVNDAGLIIEPVELE